MLQSKIERKNENPRTRQIMSSTKFTASLLGNLLLVSATLVVILPRITDGSSGTMNSPETEVDERIRTGREDNGGGHMGQLDKGHKCRILREVTKDIDEEDETATSSVWTILKCNGLTNFTITLDHIPSHVIPSVKSIEITNSTIPVLNLGIFHRFPALRNISVTHCFVSLLHGHSPSGIISLNLSSNHIKHIESSLFFNPVRDTKQDTSHQKNQNQEQHQEINPAASRNEVTIDHEGKSLETNETVVIISNGSGESDTIDISDVKRYSKSNEVLVNDTDESESKRPQSRLQIIDLSHNKISELPKSIFYLKSLKSLRLAGNQFKCEFVWEKLWEWYQVQTDPNILEDADDAFCGVVEDVRVFHYTVLGVLKARKDLEETCGSVDKNLCPECSLYALQREGNPVSHKSSHGSISISLKIGCASRNLTQLPPIPPQTWQLNISNNHIGSLSALKDPMYHNLLILDGDNNEINLESLIGTPFLEKYNYLSLQNNHFTHIPPHILSSFKTMRGQGVTFFGGNFIDCDCDVAKEIKPMLIENSKKIKDMRDIYCSEDSKGETYVRVKDLQYADVCYMESTESSNERYLYLTIAIEVILILLIIGKVWHDQRAFRRTGILPWFSSCMPRLPCDAILESVKEPPNFNNRQSMSVNSSSTNVQSHSVSHVQLKDVRGAGASSSPHSDKSSGHQSQFSSLPSSSSRTSPV